MRCSFHNILLFILIALITNGCSTRIENPVITSSSTITFVPKNNLDVNAEILLSTRVNPKSGNPLLPNIIFPIKEDEYLRAFVYLENRFALGNRPLMFHLDWVNPNGTSIFCKQFSIEPYDSTTTLNSTIALSPQNRIPGEYRLRVYLFRELIAEKLFTLQSLDEYNPDENSDLSAIIHFGSRADRKTGKILSPDSIFTISKKSWIHSYVELTNRFAYGNEDLDFRVEWIDPDGKAFFARTINLLASDSSSYLKSSVSFSPETRKEGTYCLQIKLFRQIIAEKKFEIQVIEAKPEVSNASARVSISMCSSIDKKTGQPININKVFSLSKKARVHAHVQLFDVDNPDCKPLVFHLAWVDPNGKTFFRKPFELNQIILPTTISTSISIEPESRQSGNYLLQVFLFNKKIGQESFQLVLDKDTE